MLHGRALETVSSARYLGVDISNDLSWKTHINRITSNANKSLGFFKRNIKANHPQLKAMAYKALVRPQLEYASYVWDPFTAADRNGPAESCAMGCPGLFLNFPRYLYH